MARQLGQPPPPATRIRVVALNYLAELFLPAFVIIRGAMMLKVTDGFVHSRFKKNSKQFVGFVNN
jgi:hypothetical protein